jgi:hypothetical protein
MFCRSVADDGSCQSASMTVNDFFLVALPSMIFNIISDVPKLKRKYGRIFMNRL